MRLTKIYTRQGDAGTTHFAGEKIFKDEIIIELIGTLDELNSYIGLVMAYLPPDYPSIPCLLTIQQKLFDLGGELHSPDYPAISAKDISQLEQQLDEWNEQLPPLTEFVLPRGTPATCATHIARTVCRRAERIMVKYERQAGLANKECLRFLNRLSDMLFVFARILAREDNPEELLWQGPSRSDATGV